MRKYIIAYSPVMGYAIGSATYVAASFAEAFSKLVADKPHVKNIPHVFSFTTAKV